MKDKIITKKNLIYKFETLGLDNETDIAELNNCNDKFQIIDMLLEVIKFINDDGNFKVV